MRLRELAQKELIDFNEGTFLGPVGKADLWVDELTGEVKALIIESGKKFFAVGLPEKEIALPWTSIIKIGKDVVIVEVENEYKK
ncbi:MAG: YlmC/YmxH family sporulation protein [Dethiobacteria bacterium]